MKKGIALLLALVMALALAACTQTPPPSRTDGEGTALPDEGYSAGNVDIVQLNGFRSINIDWTSGLVTVELYDGQGIELSETMMDGGDVSLKMEWRVDEDDSTLDILSQPLTVSGGVALTLTEKPSVPVDVVFRTASGQLDSDVDSTVGADCVWEIETTSGDAVIRIAA